MPTLATSPQPVALVTGASSGIGKACAEHLARLGYVTYAASRNIRTKQCAGAIALAMDVTNDESVARGVEEILAAQQRLDVVVNCAGFGVAGAIEETSVAAARRQFETNFFGVLRVCRAVLPTMRAQQSGVIVNIGSLAGTSAIPFQGVYSASKFAISGLTEALRMEVAPLNIRVVLIEPGDFATGFTSKRERVATLGEASPYRAACDTALAKMEQEERAGPPPEQIAQLLEKIIRTRRPKLRYTAGTFVQRFGVGLKRLLPQKLYEKLIKQHYGLK